ncbi:hypothetical protein BV25DRAFT_1920659 [Artomyces pyxidatus]|uniref:Uncharacterized protein n=1 Tax=Artomyces pyxidatus TaxID=48021 RepID=A0ACB8SKV8_9AGAM|nr:hypothetical protein BV25DRAFT_1920659 [Artomyces pyxidatus]
MSPKLQEHQDSMEDIVLHAVADDPLERPPSVLLNLLLTCRRFYDMLNVQHNPRLYYRLFVDKFDAPAVARRLPEDAMHAANVAHELRGRYSALQCFRRGNLDDPQLTQAFLVAYLMLLEDDGKNMSQLLWAGLPALLEEYIVERLHVGADASDGWPAVNKTNALVVALFWQMTTRHAIDRESEERRDRIMTVLQPYALAGFQYSFLNSGFDPVTMIGPHRMRFGFNDAAVPTACCGSEALTIQYFGQALCLHLPSLSLHAILSYIARFETHTLVIPPNLPRTRAEHPAPGLTCEDIDEYNQQCRTRPIPHSTEAARTDITRSQRHDIDWARALHPDPSLGLAPRAVSLYTPGVLTGAWQGTRLIPSVEEYTALRTGGWDPSSVRSIARWPFFCTLQEHNRYSSPVSCPTGHEWDDDSNAPVLRRSNGTSRADDLQNGNSPNKVLSKTFTGDLYDDAPGNVQSGRFTPDDSSGIVDVTLSGTTDQRHAAAWGAYNFLGRVRLSDGLVVFVREDPQVDMMNNVGRILFVGYLLSEQNLVGRWRRYEPNGSDPSLPYEGIWSLCKQD